MQVHNFNNLFDAYFGLRYTSVDPTYAEDDVYEDELPVSLDNINIGDILQHPSGCEFCVLQINEDDIDFSNTLLVTALYLGDNETQLLLNDAFLKHCFKK